MAIDTSINKADSGTQKWTYQIGRSGTLTLKTGGKYVDRDIDVITKLGSLNNAATEGESYSVVSSTVGTIIPSGGSLYINEGWFENTSIPLSLLVPDESAIKPAAAEYILQGYKAYDNDGNLITGTLETITDKIPTKYYTVTASSVLTAPDGYITSSKIPSGNVDGNVYLQQGDITLGQVTLSPSNNIPDITPTLTSNISAASVNTSTVKVTSATVAPDSGYYFSVKTETSDAAESTTVTASVAPMEFKQGWMESSPSVPEIAGAPVSVAVKSTTSNIYYSIQSGSHSIKVSDNTESITPQFTTVPTVKAIADLSTVSANTNIDSTRFALVTNKPTTGYYIGVTGSASANDVVVKAKAPSVTDEIKEGYITDLSTTLNGLEQTETIKTTSDSTPKYITLSTADFSFNSDDTATEFLYPGDSASVNVTSSTSKKGEAAITLSTTVPSTDDYWTINASASGAKILSKDVTYKVEKAGWMPEKNTTVIVEGKSITVPTSNSAPVYVAKVTYSTSKTGTVTLKNTEYIVPTAYNFNVASDGYDVAGTKASIAVFQGEYDIT